VPDLTPTRELDALAQSYEAIPYPFYAHPESYLGRVEFLAKLFGLPSSLQSGARILEIGCAAGGNLIPMAYRFPHSSFVGIDLAKGQVEQATHDSHQLKISNIRFLQGSFEHLNPDDGAFDYIIAHGVFSWLPAEKQRALLEKMRQLLHPHGVGYVSFNTYPGWASRMAVRQMLRFHLAPYQKAPFSEQIEHSRTLLTAVCAQLPSQSSPWRLACERVQEELQHAPQSYLAHDLLEFENHPCFFVEFNDLLRQAGLRFLCDTHLSGMDGIGLNRDTRGFIDQYVGPDQIAREQYFDFMVDRAYRAVLVTPIGAPVRKTLTEDAVPKDFFVVGRVATQAGGTLVHRDTATPISLDDQYSQDVLVYLDSIFPAATTVKNIEQNVPSLAPSGSEPRRYLLGLLVHLFARRMVDLTTTNPTQGVDESAAAYPTVPVFIRYFAKRQERIPNLRHATVTLPAELRQFAARLNGEVEPGQLIAELRGSSSEIAAALGTQDSSNQALELLAELRRVEILTPRN
jgi:SAM-dependent methyltransferase